MTYEAFLNSPIASDLDKIPPRVYTDLELFEEELEKIFYKTWICVGHESEVSAPGDFKRYDIGRRPVIVSRDRKDEIHVLLNRCGHRGATVCEPQRGRMATGFTCPYHSWSYSLDGRLRGIPYPDGYPEDIDKTTRSLVKLRTEVYQGLIFATFDPEAEDLTSFLGSARRWIDLFVEQGAGFELMVQGAHQFTYNANWKIQLENVTDGYHFPLVHRSWMTSVDDETAEMLSFMDDPTCVTHALDNGHSVGIMVPEHVDLSQDDGSEKLQARFEAVVESMSGQFTDEEIRRVVRSLHGAGFNLTVFPNLALSMGFIRLLNPIAVDRTYNAHLALGYKDGPVEANRARLRIHEHFQGPFGFGTPDDAEIWERVQRGASTGEDIPILLDRGLNRETNSAGRKTSHITDETGMRTAYAQWKEMMSR